MKEIVVLIRDIPMEEQRYIMDMMAEGKLTSADLNFYHIRDEHFDEGFAYGESILVDDNVVLSHYIISLKESLMKKIKWII